MPKPFAPNYYAFLLLLIVTSPELRTPQFGGRKNDVFSFAQPAERTPSIDPLHYQPTRSLCLDKSGAPQRCVPDFINAAFNLEVEVTNTCGIRHPTRFCTQTGHMGIKKDCDVCDSRVPELAHPAIYLTDFNNPNNETWWQSETMAEGIQFPNTVNLTLRLGKAYDITYVRLKFVSPRPESFSIYKKTHSNDNWIPWQYYSGSCRSTFRANDKAPILPGNEAVAQCTREFSDISPLTGGNIAYATLEGRPSAESFEESDVLQEWVTATEIMISLVRMNTFGDEIFHDQRVLRSYWYGISDFAVGGRCKCNGHASQCVKSTGLGPGEQQLVCDCQHHTTGVDCQQCEPFYVDRPWRPATSTEANECLPCSCNSLSNRCFFDEALYNETGHGGHCIDCAGNTQGPHCEQCAPNHWRRPGEHYCTACECDEIGSLFGQCDDDGQCRCKPGVTGQHCDRCSSGFYAFSSTGCQDCRCDPSGSFNNTPNCSPSSGACACKLNVEGQRCDKCKPGFFQLAMNNPFGCTPCFCFGHSSVCLTADDYYAVNITSKFIEDTEGWTAASDVRPEDVQWAQLDKAAAVSQIDQHPVYFFAPQKFLGDQRLAYNQHISLTFRIQQGNPGPSKKDIVIVGTNGQELSLPIFAQSNQIPSTSEKQYSFRLHANQLLQWSPTLREVDFIAVLANVSALKIRGTYSKGDVGFLYNFKMGSASLTPSGNGESTDREVTHYRVADWVESCRCTEGFVGQFCESCAHGYKRAQKYGGLLTKCIKCDCHGHSESCDAESGVCICQHNTAGETCERCARGWYGDALVGVPGDCKKCDCPDDGPCILMGDGDILCTECPEGYAGRKCEICAEDYFGFPTNGIPCVKCDCHGNTDPNAIGKCDTVTGECRNCIYHTTGGNCEGCAPGYWGDALAEVKGDCKPCNCYAPGSLRPSADYDALECRQTDGQCHCQPNVIGKRCDICERGFFNITSGNGCEPCECDLLGSLEGGTCNMNDGQCKCKRGVTGRRCDRCAPQHFGFGKGGCQLCDCDPTGSETPNCDAQTGQCLCIINVEGRRCDQCSENRYDLNAGCPACDDCYALIQQRKNELNGTLSDLRENLDEIQNNPVTVNDLEFDESVNSVKSSVNALHLKANRKLDGDDSQIRIQVDHLKDQLGEAERLLKALNSKNFPEIDRNSSQVEELLRNFEQTKDTTQRELSAGIVHIETVGQQQLASASQAAGRYGEKSQQLSTAASESKRLAEQQEQRRKEIIEMAEKIRNASVTALNDANEAIFGVPTVEQQVANLLSKIQDIEKKLKHTKMLAEEQLSDTNRTHNDAARMLSSVESIRLPNIVPEDLNSEAKKTNAEAEEALQKARESATRNAAILLEAEQALRETFDQIQNTLDKQKHIDRSFNEVEAFRERSQLSIDSATKVWNEAKDTYDSLSDFQGKVEQNKEEAMEELAQLSDIEKEIIDSETVTHDAEEAVGDALQNAVQANKMASESKLKAESLSKESQSLNDAIIRTNEESGSRKNSLENLSRDIEALATTTKDFENQATSDSEQSNEVLRRATVANTLARDIHDQLNDSDHKLLSSFNQLNSLDDVDDAQLAQLEQSLDEVEKRYAESESERQMKDQVQKAELNAASEKRQIDALMKELENLRNIHDSLPDKCFNHVSLEQEGQRRRRS